MREILLDPGPLFLQPAEMAMVRAPRRMKTVLGSCVAVVMRAPRLGMALMTHCMLPHSGAAARVVSQTESLKYVDSAIELMFLAFARRGVAAEELEIKLFGGADRMEADSAYKVGRRNIDAALEALAARGIVPAAGSVGGRRGRVILYDAATGETQVKILPGETVAGGAA